MLPLVVACGVEGEVCDDLAGGFVGDGDVSVFEDDHDGGSGVGSSDADVVEAALVSEGDFSELVDAVHLNGWPVTGVTFYRGSSHLPGNLRRFGEQVLCKFESGTAPRI